MKNNWSKEEHILAFNLYCKIPFTKINANYPPVCQLAKVLGRTDGAVAMKLANFARLDPALKARNISGLSQGSKGEEEVWSEFNNDWEKLAFESEYILAKYRGISIGETIDENVLLIKEGKERDTFIKQRVNQDFFRKMILASYNYECCITGINVAELLVGSHIIPWAKKADCRMNPSNGVCLNALHDKAFDKGLLTITSDFRIIISDRLLKEEKPENLKKFFLPYVNKKINLPQKFYPAREFLEYHNKHVFIKD